MQPVFAIGLMSGTSRDGIDAALIRTDGIDLVEPCGFFHVGYSPAFREQLGRACARALTLPAPMSDPLIEDVTAQLTAMHGDAVAALLAQTGQDPAHIAAIGFHGHTVAHRPDRGWTWQIGDGGTLARETGLRVVYDFRSADVAAGGQGAPLIPVYHRAMTAALPRPVALLNLGGIANMTLIDPAGEMIAFDCGMANALIDDWVQQHFGIAYDLDGAIAARGSVDEATVARMMAHPFFTQPAPKSLDRDDFTTALVAHLSPEDGTATLTAFTAAGIARGCAMLPMPPRRILVAGGGRLNPMMLDMIARRTGADVSPVDALGWNGDATEAEGFAYMAVRRLMNLPISFPGTTGVATPMTGGLVV